MEVLRSVNVYIRFSVFRGSGLLVGNLSVDAKIGLDAWDHLKQIGCLRADKRGRSVPLFKVL